MKTTRIAAAALIAAVAGTVLAGCAGPVPEEEPTAGPPAEGFPVTIEHAFGETEITSRPERVATWGWGAADAALALGVTPVAIPQEPYGGDDEGVLPWIEEELAESGAEQPAMLTAGDEAPIQEILEAAPDLVLAPYSGLTQEEYDQLSGAGVDVVAYPDKPWATPWRDVVRITGEALGRSEAAEEVLAGIDERITAAAEEHPEFEGVSFASVWDVGGTFYVYLPTDPRVEFATDLGLQTAPAVTELDTGESTFYYSLPYDVLDRLESDLLILYADTQKQADTFLASDRAQLLPQVTAGRVAEVTGEAAVAAVSPPTALSLTWGMEDFLADLEAGLAG